MEQIADGVFFNGIRDYGRRVFDEVIPLPDGTSYNSYIVSGQEKTALIDTCDPSRQEEFLSGLRGFGKKIDYIISNHAEQDHSGCIPLVLGLFPDAKVVANQKCREMLALHLHVNEDRFQTVDEGDTLQLGGKTLRFIMAPWVHWPETMLTYLEEDRILFPCDLFGSHLAAGNTFPIDLQKSEISAKRYYAEIMMPFRNSIAKHMEKISALPLRMIAPSHGEVHDKPEFILSLYRSWISDSVKNSAVILYASMHGSTRSLALHLRDSLVKLGVEAKAFDLGRDDIGDVALSLVDSATVVFASPAFLIGPHPLVVNAAYLANLLKPKTRFVSVICSYGWGSKVDEQIKSLVPNLRAEALASVAVKGLPTDSDFEKIDALAREISARNLSVTNPVKVTVYSTPTCPFCIKAKEFLKENNILFEDINVLDDAKARDYIVGKSGSTGVPQIEINGKIILGFNKDRLKEELDLK